MVQVGFYLRHHTRTCNDRKKKRKKNTKRGPRECSPQRCRHKLAKAGLHITSKTCYDDDIVHTHWIAHLKLSTHTNCQKFALTRIPWSDCLEISEHSYKLPKLVLLYTPNQNTNYLKHPNKAVFLSTS